MEDMEPVAVEVTAMASEGVVAATATEEEAVAAEMAVIHRIEMHASSFVRVNSVEQLYQRRLLPHFPTSVLRLLRFALRSRVLLKMKHT